MAVCKGRDKVLTELAAGTPSGLPEPRSNTIRGKPISRSLPQALESHHHELRCKPSHIDQHC